MREKFVQNSLIEFDISNFFFIYLYKYPSFLSSIRQKKKHCICIKSITF